MPSLEESKGTIVAAVSSFKTVFTEDLTRELPVIGQVQKVVDLIDKFTGLSEKVKQMYQERIVSIKRDAQRHTDDIHIAIVQVRMALEAMVTKLTFMVTTMLQAVSWMDNNQLNVVDTHIDSSLLDNSLSRELAKVKIVDILTSDDVKLCRKLVATFSVGRRLKTKQIMPVSMVIPS